MKFSWRDIAVTLLAIAGGAIFWAKAYSYSWAVIGSWRSSVAVLALIGVLMTVFSGFDYRNLSVLNMTEMVFWAAGAVLAIVGMTGTNDTLFYSLGTIMGIVWFMDTGRHIGHSLLGSGKSGAHHAPVH